MCSHHPPAPTATGYDLEPLPNGDVLIQFFGDDGETFNAQVTTRTALAQFPAVVHVTFLAVDQGQDAALAFLDHLSTEQHVRTVATIMRSGAVNQFDFARHWRKRVSPLLHRPAVALALDLGMGMCDSSHKPGDPP